MRPAQRFTVFDMMEAKGIFSANPANVTARDPVTGVSLYKGPVPFPKMFYHPKGEKRAIVGSFAGAKELVSRIANNAAEAEQLLRAGWHEHPADAIAAGLTEEDIANGAVVPPKGAASRIDSLEKEKEKLLRELEELRKQKAAGQLVVDNQEDEVI